LIRVVASALKEFPELNASPEAKGIRRHPHVNVGIAVAMDQGLVVPVLKAAEAKTVGEIVRERARLVERARQGRVDSEDLSGGTFTISNLGMFQVDRFLPVLNTSQALLLAVGAIAERPVVREGTVTIRPMMSLTLACDHRVTDGAGAAQFFARLAQMIEQPVTLIDL
jgi:pyruvate dehydrogenase E2 component (dihydrolipoamide acetyltransferase)